MPAPAPPARTSSSGVASKRIGPFPLWIWVVGAGGVALYFYRRNNAGGSPASLPGNTGTTTGGGVDGGLGLSPAAPAVEQPTVNDWAQKALAALVHLGVNPGRANDAIYRYIQGGQLNAIQSNIVSRAIQLVGYPPEVLPFYGVFPAPPKPSVPGHSGAPAPKPIAHPPIGPSPSPATRYALTRARQSATVFGVALPTGTALSQLMAKFWGSRLAPAGTQQRAAQAASFDISYITNHARLVSPTQTQITDAARWITASQGGRYESLSPAEKMAASQQAQITLLEQLNPVRAR